MKLEKILQQRQDIWKGKQANTLKKPAVSTGFQAFDAVLAGSGWPKGAVTELLTETSATPVLSLLMPVLAKLSQEKQWVVLLDPPFIPYPIAWQEKGVDVSRLLIVNTKTCAEHCWALEQALRSSDCDMVMSWQNDFEHKQLRRLQLAAEQHQAMAMLIRPINYAEQASPAPLRIKLSPSYHGINIEIIKRSGGWAIKPFCLNLDIPVIH